MKTPAVIVILSCCAVSVLSVAEDARKSKPSATVAPAQAFTVGPTTTMTAPNKTTVAPNTTTTAPNTTTVAPNTTTAAPNTTTVAPNTTTAAPNTTTVAPNTTTTAPNTTTTAPNTTTTTTKGPPAPTPTPSTNLTPGTYYVHKDNKTCVMATMALELRIDKSNLSFIVQPNKTTAVGVCNETRANLTLVFEEGFITFIFNKSTPENIVYVDTLSFSISYPSSGANGPYTANNMSVHLFPAKIGHSYSCKKDSLYMGNGLYLDVTKDQMQAYNLTNSAFGRSDFCPADQPDYRVAIGVGVALLILIVIVVVVYIVSRKKRTDGYQSL
ncbi:macrosialin-like [Anabas testudineus]|uniref:Lysosome-associated membrane glycoprotein 2-like luminal domain-containing protein n=1 Tax=Anabas testudineus TaxID=64144 RepID=A0A3Q1H3W4_ANATE|nr:macrosialin-like [Anabas testudineus]